MNHFLQMPASENIEKKTRDLQYELGFNLKIKLNCFPSIFVIYWISSIFIIKIKNLYLLSTIMQPEIELYSI